MYHTVTDNYQNSISFITPDNRVQRFKIGNSDSTLGCSLDDVLHVALSIDDGNIAENYSETYSQPQLNSLPLATGISMPNTLPKLRARVVTYKLLIMTPRTVWSGDNQTWRTGRGVKKRVQDFVRDFLDYGDLKVQYGTWGGVDFGGYLVDSPQVSYNEEETQATLTFTLQFTHPITLHPNFTNSRLWSSETQEIDWATLTTTDNGNLRAVNATRSATTGALTASFSNVRRWSNIGFLCTTATNTTLNGTLTVEQSTKTIGALKTNLYNSTNRLVLFTTPKSQYITVTSANNAENLYYWSAASGSQVGVIAAPPATAYG